MVIQFGGNITTVLVILLPVSITTPVWSFSFPHPPHRPRHTRVGMVLGNYDGGTCGDPLSMCGVGGDLVAEGVGGMVCWGTIDSRTEFTTAWDEVG